MTGGEAVQVQVQFDVVITIYRYRSMQVSYQAVTIQYLL